MTPEPVRGLQKRGRGKAGAAGGVAGNVWRVAGMDPLATTFGLPGLRGGYAASRALARWYLCSTYSLAIAGGRSS